MPDRVVLNRTLVPVFDTANVPRVVERPVAKLLTDTV
jgi:hypothetical protein